MLWGDRPDGKRIKGLSPLRVLMPHIMPTRTGATVFHEQRVDLTQTLPWLTSYAEKTGTQATLFHLLQYALVRVLVERPDLHRFVIGGVTYQRNKIELAYAVKKRMADGAPMTTVKVEFHPTDSFADVVTKTGAAIDQGRGTELLTSEKEMAVFAHLPGWLLGWLVGLQRRLDAWNLLPAALTAADPLYASAFLANLGSVGLDAPFHHLFDWGTVPIFAVLGRIHRAPWVSSAGTLEVRPTAVLRYSYDERIADGLYCAKSLEIVRKTIENPGEI